MNLTLEQVRLILCWADFCVETGDGLEKSENELYNLLYDWADAQSDE